MPIRSSRDGCRVFARRRCSLASIARAVAAAALTAVALVPAPAAAQAPTATLRGTILDQGGDAIPHVDLTARNVATGLQRQVTGGDGGAFVIPLLPPGTYDVTAKHDGFTPAEVRGLVLNVGDDVAITIKLKVATVDEQVTVTTDTSRLNMSAAVGTVVNRRFVENIPLNGRSFQSLISLTPGIATVPAGTTNTGGQFSVNGQRTSANNFLVDGVSANVAAAPGTIATNASGNLPAFTTFGTTQSLVSVDALEEFKVQTSTYAAEYGRQPGGQISIVTRSGTNTFHGSAFEYLRNDALDANDWFANRDGQPKPPMRQNDFGGTLGGPVRLPGYDGHGQTFFFFSYEGLRLRQPRFDLTNVPTLALRAQAPAALQPILNAFPLPNGRDLGTGLAELTAATSDPSTLNATSLRVDHTLTSKMTLFVRYNDAPSDTSGTVAGGSLAVVNGRNLDTRTVTVGSTALLTSRMTNDLRVNYTDNDARLSLTPISYGGNVLPPRSALIPEPFDSPTAQGWVILNFPGRTATGVTQVNLSGGTSTSQRQLNIVDSLTYVTGAHQFKFGVDYRRVTQVSEYPSYAILPQFNSQQEVLAGGPASITIRANRSLKPTFTNFSAYTQDTWRASRRLTMDLGVRWDVNPAPSEAGGHEQVAVTQIDDLAAMQLAPLGTAPWKTAYGNVAPRIGLAYQLSQAPGRETIVRGGFGLFFDTGNDQGSSNFGNVNFPYSSSRVATGVRYPLIPEQVAPAPAAIDAGIVPPYPSFTAFDPELQLPYTRQWNVAVEQALGTRQTLTISYVGAAGRRLLQATRLTLTPINPDFTGFTLTRNTATSDYHALQMQFQRRLSRGLQVLASYTWSHAIDDDSGSNTQRVARRGDAAFDVRHVAGAAVTYDLPGPRERGLARAVLSRWSLDTTLHAQSALPVDLVGTTITDPADGSTINVRPNVVAGVPWYLDDPAVPGGRVINAAAFTTPPTGDSGNLGRNALRGFATWQIDAALRRQFTLTGPLTLQLRVEAFNLFNHANFGAIQTTLNAANFGQATGILSRQLGGLSQLYQIGGPRSMQLSVRLAF